MSFYVLSQHFVDTRSHDIGDMMSHGFVDTRSHDIGDMMSHGFVDTVLAGCSVRVDGMTNALSPRVQTMIINYDPSQPYALPVTEFCRSVKVSRSVFYKIRDQAAIEAPQPCIRAPGPRSNCARILN